MFLVETVDRRDLSLKILTWMGLIGCDLELSQILFGGGV